MILDLEREIDSLQESGKISAEDARGLAEALKDSRAEDALLLKKISEHRAHRRFGRFLIHLFLVTLVLMLVAMFWVLSLSKPGELEQDHSLSRLSGQELSSVINSLEQKLVKPGVAADYQALADAYRLRYQVSKNISDLTASEQLTLKADNLTTKTTKGGIMGKSIVLFAVLFVLIVAVVIGMMIVLPYNSLAKKDENVDARWSQVETVMQRRLDLIPNLVETVKGYAGHEQETLLAVTEARTKVLNSLATSKGKAPTSEDSAAQLVTAETGLSAALVKLFALAESYPDIKASNNFMALQDQLEGTENRIAVERQRYNEVVREYNSSLRTFPSNVIGSLFGFEGRAYFQSKLGAEKPVAVSFENKQRN